MRFKESEVVNVIAILHHKSGQMKRFYSKKSCKKDFELEVLATQKTWVRPRLLFVGPHV